MKEFFCKFSRKVHGGAHTIKTQIDLQDVQQKSISNKVIIRHFLSTKIKYKCNALMSVILINGHFFPIMTLMPNLNKERKVKD